MNSVPWQIPGFWQWAPLGDVVHIAQDLVDPRSVPDAIHIAPNHMIGGTGDLLPYQTVREDGVTSPKQRFQPGQILFSKIRPYLRKAALVDFEGVCSADVYPLDVSDGIERRYVLRWLLSPEFRDIALPYQGRSLLPKINQAGLASTLAPIPPGGEQRRIVAKVDSLFAKTKRAREELGHIPRLIERYKQAILAAAFRGDLTADWRIREGHRQAQYQLVAISELVKDIRYGTSQKCSFDPSKTPVLRIPNIGAGQIQTDDLKHATFTSAEITKLALQVGDLLVIRSNGSLDLVGRAAVVSHDEAGFLYAGYLIRLRVDKSRVVPEYLLLALSEPSIRREIEELAKSTSGVNNINSKQLAALAIPIPSLREQDEVVARIRVAFDWVDRIARERASASRLTDRLDQSILSKAFRGELVPQDPNDEPASVLMERIRAAREVQPKRRGRRKHTQ